MSIAEKFETIADRVYEQGIDNGKTDVGNMLSRNGKRSSWRYAFESSDFSGHTFKPTIYPTTLGSVFYNYSGKTLPEGIDFSKAIIAENVTDTAKIPYQLFAYTRELSKIPDMNIPVQYRYTNTFYNCHAVKEIEIIRVAETTSFSQTFKGCLLLENVNFEGTIGRDISFEDCPLTVESMKNVIELLKDYSQSEPEYTLTFNDDCWNELEASGSAHDGDTWKNYVIKRGWLIG